MPVTVVLGRMPTISTSALTSRTPRSMRSVTTVPRPVMVRTASLGMRNGFSTSRAGVSIQSSTAASSSVMPAPHAPVGSVSAWNAETRTIGVLSPSNSYSLSSSPTSSSTSEDFLVVDHVALVQGHHNFRDADLAGQDDVLLGLRHRAVGGGDQSGVEDC